MEKNYEELVERWKKIDKENEEAVKKAEAEWRAAFGKDSAGHMLGVMRYVQAQLASLQTQLDSAWPLGAVQRELARMAEYVASLDARAAKLEGKGK